MTPVTRVLAGVLLVASVLAGSLSLTAGPAAARSCAEPSADVAAGNPLVLSGVVRDSRSSGDGDEATSGLCAVVVGPGTSFDQVLRDLGEGTEPSPGYTRSESVGLTYDQWRTGRLVLGVLGLSAMAFIAFRASRARQARRRTTDDA